MPAGQAKMEREMLVSGLRTSFIRLRAAKKLTGIARAVPRVVASNARNTVSMIFPQVSSAVCVKCGEPTLRRVITRIYWTSSLGRLGNSIKASKCPLSSVLTVPRCNLTSLGGIKKIGPSVPGSKLKPSTRISACGSAHCGVKTIYVPLRSGSGKFGSPAGQGTRMGALTSNSSFSYSRMSGRARARRMRTSCSCRRGERVSSRLTLVTWNP